MTSDMKKIKYSVKKNIIDNTIQHSRTVSGQCVFEHNDGIVELLGMHCLPRQVIWSSADKLI